MLHNANDPFLVKTFVRHRSRYKSERKKNLRNEILPKIKISSLPEIENISQFAQINLEIGSGYGDTVNHLAKTNPDNLYIASEVYIDAILSTIGKMDDENLTNIRMFTEDGRKLLAEIPDGVLSNLYLFFPDPWPKTKHHKRRIFQTEFLKLVHKKLKNDGILWTATDDDSYKEHISTVIYFDSISENRLFKWDSNNQNDFLTEPSWWKRTKYQEKAIQAGRECIFLKLDKTS